MVCVVSISLGYMNDFVDHTSASLIEGITEQLFRPRFKRCVLENGLTLVHLPDFSSKLVSVQVWVKTGSIHEGTLAGSGLSHFLEHLLFKGTERRDGKQISREVHALGAEMNAYTTFERTVYYMDALSTNFAEAVDLLADIVLHSTLPAGELECERDVILREIDMDLDDPDRQLSQALFRTAFRLHPCREPVIGHRALFEQINRDELWEYYTTRYVPNNMVVAVAGAVSPEDCLIEIETAFGKVRRGRLATITAPGEPTQLSSRKEVIAGDYAVSRGALGFKVPHLSDPDSPALDLLAYALGEGESSLFWERLRNQQRLVHYIDCRNWNSADCGLLEITYVCDHEKQPEVEPAILEVIRELCESGISEQVLQKVHRQILNDEINRQKTVSGKASRIGFAEAVIGDIHYGHRYFKQLQSTGLQDLQSVAKRYLIDEHMSAAVIRPEIITADAASPAKINTDSEAEPYEQIQFANGARLILQNDTHLPKVHIRCVMLGGPLYEPVNQRGISELLAELLTKDTANRSASEISTLVDQIGGSFSADGGNNTINLAIEVLPSDLDTALELLIDALTCPVFEARTLQTEKEAQIALLKEEDDEIFDYGFRKLREYFFGEHPFAIGSTGRIEDLEKLTRNDLVTHFNHLVTASNSVIAIVGDFEREKLLEHLHALLESKIRSAPFELAQTPANSNPKEAMELTEPLDREQAVLFQAYPDAGVCDGNYITGELLNELFNGMSSRLFERVREDKGMAYYVGSSRMLGLQTGLFTFYAGTNTEQVAEVAAEINVEIARVKAGQVTQEELQRCRTRLKAARLMNRQTIGARALHAAINVIYGLPIETDAEYAEKLDKVSPESMAEFAKTFFDKEHSVKLVVGSYS